MSGFLRASVGDVKRPSVTQYRSGFVTESVWPREMRLLGRISDSPSPVIPDPLFESPTARGHTATTFRSLSLSLSLFRPRVLEARNALCDLNFVSRDKLPDKSDFRHATTRHPRSKARLPGCLPPTHPPFFSLCRFVPSSRLAIPRNPIGRLSESVCSSRASSVRPTSLASFRLFLVSFCELIVVRLAELYVGFMGTLFNGCSKEKAGCEG